MKSQLLRFLAKHPFETFNQKQLSARLGISDKAGRQQIASLILDLAENKILQEQKRGKYKINPKFVVEEEPKGVILGTVDMKSTGKAYILPQDEHLDDIFIAANNTNHALNGDLVKVALFPQRKGRRLEGKIIDVIKRHKENFVGTLQILPKYAFVTTDSSSMPVDIFIPKEDIGAAQNGQKVLAKITDWPKQMLNPTGKIVMVLGNPGENNVEMQSILAELDFPLFFPSEVEAEAAKIPLEIPQSEIAKRRDFRNIPTMTIDPADAKDFDDALSFRKLDNGNVEVGVHIADVTYYVQPNSIIDKEAYDRATSIYLVDRTIPMLPEKLCNGVCSLRPDEDKLAFSAVFEMNEKAQVVNSWFGKTVIRSIRRFAYEDAQTVIENGEGDCAEQLLPMHNLAAILRKKRFQSGAINFHSTEVRFQLDEEARPVGVYVKESKEANWLIEEFMLLANKHVAEFVGRNKSQVSQSGKPTKAKTFIYRVHAEPNAEKLATFVQFVAKLGYKMKTGNRSELATSFNNLFKNVAGKGEENMIETIAVRTMSKAYYSTENIGHYGLSFPFYSHFTSPIRRYPDVMAHRLLERYLEDKNSVSVQEYEEYCDHCSKMEKKAADAERLSIKYKQTEFMKDHIGEVFNGVISGVSKYGIFVEIEGNKCEGMVSLQTLHDDIYYLDEDNYQVIGRRYGQQYKLGDKVKIKVQTVDMAKKRMDFLLVEN
ncbi:MAG: ribonuclease R [Bacteroidales bacterium]|jgi:ribonuclease R|nr:ribonuclease R [Bacteroidales bacterium]